jgi:alcohol dehydrogenase (NADP+)
MQKHAGSLNFILDAVSADHDINAYLNLLARDGNLTLVGAPPKPLGVAAFGLIMGRRGLSGSMIGGIAETQEMLDFCGQNNITADVEVIARDTLAVLNEHHVPAAYGFVNARKLEGNPDAA